MSKHSRMDYVKYTLAHRKAFREVEKELFGKVSISGYLHDMDKVLLYPIFGKDMVSKWHREFSKHHKKACKYKHYCQMVVDWECARKTKADKPLNAYDTLYKFYPELEDKILPILKELKLDYSLLEKGN